MGAVVGTHGKGGQIIEIACSGGAQGVLFWRWITGIDIAGKDFLTNIIDFHSVPPASNILIPF
jgi:hypothetical protein